MNVEDSCPHLRLYKVILKELVINNKIRIYICTYLGQFSKGIPNNIAVCTKTTIIVIIQSALIFSMSENITLIFCKEKTSQKKIIEY